MRRRRRWPTRHGWDAGRRSLGILAFAWVELVYVNRDDPSQLATMALVYAAIQLVGMSVYGIEPWSRNADAFGVYFRLFSMLSPLHWRDARRCTCARRWPARPKLDAGSGTVALLCTMIGTVSFDGLSQGALWTGTGGIAPKLQQRFINLGFSGEVALEITFTVGLLFMVGVVSGIYRLGVIGMHSVRVGHSTTELSRRFVHSLIPIALAYVIAHYFSLLTYQGQAMAYLVSDPLGHGVGPLRHRHGDHQLQRHRRQRRLVRAGLRARVRPRLPASRSPTTAPSSSTTASATRPARSTGCSRSWSPSRAWGSGCSQPPPSDGSGTTALERSVGALASGLGVDDHVLHVRLAGADLVLQAAGQLVRVGQRHAGRDGDRHEDDQPTVGVQQPQLPRRLAGAGARELADAPALRLVGRGALLVGAGGDGLLERLQMRLHVVDARLLAQGRLHSLGHVVRLADRDVAGRA